MLDTNACLDWLVFRDPGISPLATAIQAGQLRWLACAAMRQELAQMLTHPRLACWQADAAASLAVFDALALMLPPPCAALDTRLRCTDPDDQVFIDLALGAGAQWLITHDRALLKLGRRAAGRGLQVLRPAAWPAAAQGTDEKKRP